MKKFLLGAIVFVVCGGSALAADLPARGPAYNPPPPPAYSWTGFYIAAGGGNGMWTADTTTIDAVTGRCVLCIEQRQGGRGWFGTVGAGFDFQVSERIVLGVLADYDFGSLKGTIQDQSPFFAGEIKQTSAWAVGARLGWLVTPNLLSFVNGGYTQARFSDARMVDTFTGTAFGFSTPAFTTSGYFLGGGVEYEVLRGWSWKNEYRLASYDSRTLRDCTATAVCLDSITFEPTVQTIRSELVYRFNMGGPVYAKY
jgi:outer membrane immunogenic protein